MRHNTSKFAAALLVLWPGIALGLTVDGYDGTADCNGWNTNLQLTMQPSTFLVHLETAGSSNSSPAPPRRIPTPAPGRPSWTGNTR